MNARQIFLPFWVVYVVHGFALLLAGFSSYYVFLFSVLLNRCAPCVPGENTAACAGCPASMQNKNNPNKVRRARTPESSGGL